MIAVLAEVTGQQTVDDWPSRLLALAVTLGFIGLALWGMRRGWVHRQQRQADIPAPADQPVANATWLAAEPGVYLGTARAGDWLDRIAVHDLGVRSAATCGIGAQGVWLDRQGARSVFIPHADIEQLRLDRGVAATVRDKDSVLIVRWRLGAATVDSGFRAQTADGQRALIEAATAAGMSIQTEAPA